MAEPDAGFDASPALSVTGTNRTAIGGRAFSARSHRFFHQRIFSLVSVSQADGRAQLALRDVLEAHQVFAGLRRVAGLLVGARDAELSRSMQRIQFERMLEGVDRLRILLELR